eukprot:EG_transcript_13795
MEGPVLVGGGALSWTKYHARLNPSSGILVGSYTPTSSTQFEFRVKGATLHQDGRVLRLFPNDGGAQPLTLEFEDDATLNKWKAALGNSGAGGSNAGSSPGLRIASNILELVGNTPLLLLNQVTEGCVAKVAVKLEFFNPVCSVKDRLALGIIRDLEAEGKITPGKTVLVEATSGNTGIGVAAMAIHRGYKVILCMPETMSLERRTLLKAFGAEIVLTPGARGMKGAILKAEQIVKSNPDAILTAQFETVSNAKIHRETTGPEIWRDTNGTVDIFVSGVGTGGTITGVAEFLKSKGSKCRIVAVEPAESPILSGGKPGPHKIQGIGAGFVPGVLRKELIDEVVQVSSENALEMAGRLPREEGLLTGISSGAAVYAAVQLARRPENAGKLIVAIVPSFGERYLSTPLFAATRDAAAALPTTPIDD